jgi:hypothetical protein
MKKNEGLIGVFIKTAEVNHEYTNEYKGADGVRAFFLWVV